MTYDQTKPCPRCQQRAPELRTMKLTDCIYCNFPGPDPRYSDYERAREMAAASVMRGRCSKFEGDA